MRRVILILCNIALLSIAVNSATPLAQILGKVDDNRIDSFHPIVKRNLSHNVLQTKEENRVNDKRKVRVHRGKAKKDKKHGKKGKGKKADNIANKKSGKGKKKKIARYTMVQVKKKQPVCKAARASRAAQKTTTWITSTNTTNTLNTKSRSCTVKGRERSMQTKRIKRRIKVKERVKVRRKERGQSPVC